MRLPGVLFAFASLFACVACTELRVDDVEGGATIDGGPDGAIDRDGGDGGDGDGGDGDGDGDASESMACERDPDACPLCSDGDSCALGEEEDDGVCVDGECVQCADDDDCEPTPLSCREAYCTDRHACSTRPVANGSACSGGFCNDEADCVECAIDENCAANEACESERCACKSGYVPNSGDDPGCNFDECVLEDDNRCALPGGNTCANTDEGYSCSCDAAWKEGPTESGPQCFQGGDGAVATVTNGATWNISPGFALLCSNAFAETPPVECPLGTDGKPLLGHVAWLNLCGLVDPPCNSLVTRGQALLAADLQRVTYSASLESYGEAEPTLATEIFDPAVGDVILVRTLSLVGVMRITEASGSALTFEWASVWRDHCFLPGGTTCSAVCNCPDGS